MTVAFVTFAAFAAALWMLLVATASTGDARVPAPALKGQGLRDRRTGASPPRR